MWPRRAPRSPARGGMRPTQVRSSTGYRGVRLRDSGKYAAEITVDRTRMCLGTFPTPEEAARVYDAVAWRYGRPRSGLNFPEIETAEQATFVAPDFRVCCRAIEEEDRKAHQQLKAEQADAAAMEKLRRENPELVMAEYEFYASREAKKKNTEAGPSTAALPSAPVIKIEDSDSSGLSDYDWEELMNDPSL